MSDKPHKSGDMSDMAHRIKENIQQEVPADKPPEPVAYHLEHPEYGNELEWALTGGAVPLKPSDLADGWIATPLYKESPRGR